MGNDPSIIFPDMTVGLKIVSAYTGEQVYWIQENGRYQYEVLSEDYVLKETSGIIRGSWLNDLNNCGTIEPGNYVGLLKLELYEKESCEKIAETYIDVHSTKLDYDSDYRLMLEDIADWCADFIFQLEAPVEQQYTPDDQTKEATLAQRLYFLKNLLGGDDFQAALRRVVEMPNTRWHGELRTVDIRRSGRLGRYEVRQLTSGSRRMSVPDTHSIHDLMATIPEKINVRDKRDTVDTPENRFVKHALSEFLQTLEEILCKFKSKGEDKYPGLTAEINELINFLEETLSHSVFREVSAPQTLSLNSPVLQRKEGYRQVLRAWILFELAASLSWQGGDDVYAGGKRDAAALYEYWVFFRLLELVAELFEIEKPLVESLINNSDLTLKLKAGKQLVIDGEYRGAGRPLKVQFSYNRTFGGDRTYPVDGSWSRQLRPDYTLSLWPAEFTADQAENQELITHVHLDAKYKVDKYEQFFGADTVSENELNEEKKQQRAGMYKRADLLKMHAYRDAIRRTAGAYVVYPGTTNKDFRGFHELLPGLGAFSLRPGVTEDGSESLRQFLKEVVAHVCNRVSQREQQTYHTYWIHKEKPSENVREIMPEMVGEERTSPPKEVFVIHGWVKNTAHLEWIELKNLYNFRTDDRRGSLRLPPSVAGASYLLLHGEDEYRKGGKLYSVVSEGPRVFSKEKLIEKDYPGEPSQPYYLVYDIVPLDEGDPLALYDWDLSKVDGVGERRQSAVPKAGIPLSEFMKGAVKAT